MKITDSHIQTLRQDGFVVIENFLPREEASGALDGVHQLYSPDHAQWLAAGKKNPIANPRGLFPWDHSALNHAMTHPDLIDAAERITGTNDLRLCEGLLGVKYAGAGPSKEGWHADFGNNTLGPAILDRSEMAKHLVFFYYFTDVTKEDAPIRMMKHGAVIEEALRRSSLDCTRKAHPIDESLIEDPIDIVGPAGTLCIYTLYTAHTASSFKNPASHRAVAWVSMLDAKYTFNFPRTFTYKSGAPLSGMSRFIREASPRQLQLLGFPPARDPFWTAEYVKGMEMRYPGFRGDLYCCEKACKPQLAHAAS